ncbi:MAG: leucine-rich repeat domain-containing protein, partial [Turicibacter sp.]|nr:leucine-rich repeat domain-containing protein [Turicibacter sp.]
ELGYLRFLYLSNNQISDISPLKNLISLMYLELANNPVFPTATPSATAENIPQILENMADLLLLHEILSLTEDTDLLPMVENFNILQRHHGDYAEGFQRMNNFRIYTGEISERRIIAVVVARQPDETAEDCTLHILRETAPQSGQFSAEWQSVGITGGRWDGGVRGDSFLGIIIENDEFILRRFGGSFDSSGGSNFTYRIVNNRLIMHHAEFFHIHDHSETGERTIYNIAENFSEIRTICRQCEEFDDLLLLETPLQPGLIFDIADGLPNFEDYFIIEEFRPQRPDLYRLVPYDVASRMVFNDPLGGDLRLTASYTLELVQSERFPHLERLPLPFSEEILENYRNILGYEIPTFFYMDEEVAISYLGRQENALGRGGIFHRIGVHDVARGWVNVVLFVNDETGQIEER